MCRDEDVCGTQLTRPLAATGFQREQEAGWLLTRLCYSSAVSFHPLLVLSSTSPRRHLAIPSHYVWDRASPPARFSRGGEGAARSKQDLGERSHKPKTIRMPHDPQLFMSPSWMILWIIHMAHGYTKNTATRRVPNNHLLLFLICGIHVMMFRSRRQGHGSAAWHCIRIYSKTKSLP